MTQAARLEVWAPDFPHEVTPGDDLAALVGDAVAAALASTGSTDVPDDSGSTDDSGAANSRATDGEGLADGDIVVVTSKIVSKAEGRMVPAVDREQAISDETVRIVATRARPPAADGTPTPPLRIVENRLGLVMAAAGVDASNTPDGMVLLLPLDPDATARALRAAMTCRFGLARLGVVVTDTVGRPWRDGLVDIAIGAAGLVVADDLRGQPDAQGRQLNATMPAIVDEIAAASELVRGKQAGRPVAVVRGLGRYVTADDGPGARSLIRPSRDDLFREGSADAYARGLADGRAIANGSHRNN
ncbi:MAG: coenzyme F420-0:L-glutamate ligase [Cellulomonadaceae bacterium]|jgi:coenzyme F420-0:L-glutamate ligase/coenzyme F420-1:gamma-L-glutamate ligase|nr:coenzyme F420-0:L-glutamate ligase [Cellulomonadaceae bacterium]